MYDFPIRPGGRSQALLPAQAMFLELSQVFRGLEPARLRALPPGASVRKVPCLHRILDHPETGALDGPLFFRLSHLHRLTRRCRG